MFPFGNDVFREFGEWRVICRILQRQLRRIIRQSIAQTHPCTCFERRTELELSLGEVLNGLQQIDTNKGRGPDELHPIVLKHCPSSLAAPLRLIFNNSLAEGVFLTKCETSYINSTDIWNWQKNENRKQPGRSNIADIREMLRIAHPYTSLRSNITITHSSPTRVRSQEIMCYEFNPIREYHNEGNRVEKSKNPCFSRISKSCSIVLIK